MQMEEVIPYDYDWLTPTAADGQARWAAREDVALKNKNHDRTASRQITPLTEFSR